MLTDAGGLLLLLPANLRLIMLIKLEVNLPFKDAHPTPTEISRRTVQQGWRQRRLSPFVSLAAYEAPPLHPFSFQPGRWYAGQRPAMVLRARAEEQRVSSDASFPTHQVLPISEVLPFGRGWARSCTACLVVLSGLVFLRICLDHHPRK